MANVTTISNAAAIAACDAVAALLGGSCLIRIYNGTQPANPDVAVTSQTLLAQLTGDATAAFAAATDANPGGRATANAVTDDASANATGTASWFRALTSGAVAVIDGSVGTSGADLNLNSVAISAGSTVSITSWTLTMPET